MYEIDILENNDWVYYWENEDIKQIDKVVFKLMKERPNQYTRILKDNCVLCWLDGSDYKYWYWKERYVREKGANVDVIKSYYERQKKLELRRKGR